VVRSRVVPSSSRRQVEGSGMGTARRAACVVAKRGDGRVAAGNGPLGFHCAARNPLNRAIAQSTLDNLSSPSREGTENRGALGGRLFGP
jgi:hypothetical protein